MKFASFLVVQVFLVAWKFKSWINLPSGDSRPIHICISCVHNPLYYSKYQKMLFFYLHNRKNRLWHVFIIYCILDIANCKIVSLWKLRDHQLNALCCQTKKCYHCFSVETSNYTLCLFTKLHDWNKIYLLLLLLLLLL